MYLILKPRSDNLDSILFCVKVLSNLSSITIFSHCLNNLPLNKGLNDKPSISIRILKLSIE